MAKNKNQTTNGAEKKSLKNQGNNAANSTAKSKNKSYDSSYDYVSGDSERTSYGHTFDEDF